MEPGMEIIRFKTQFQGKSIDLPGISVATNVYDLKLLIESVTRVPVERQKLLGLVKGKLPDDVTPLQQLVGRFKGTQPYKFTLMGTPDDKLVAEPSYRGSTLNDFEAAVEEGDVDRYPSLARGMPLDLRVRAFRAHAQTHASSSTLRNQRQLKPLTVATWDTWDDPANSSGSRCHRRNASSKPPASEPNNSDYGGRDDYDSSGGGDGNQGAASARAVLWALRGKASRRASYSMNHSLPSPNRRTRSGGDTGNFGVGVGFGIDRFAERNRNCNSSDSRLGVNDAPRDKDVGAMVRWSITISSKNSSNINSSSNLQHISQVSVSAAAAAIANDVGADIDDGDAETAAGADAGTDASAGAAVDASAGDDAAAAEEEFERALAGSRVASFGSDKVGCLLWEAGAGLAFVEALCVEDRDDEEEEEEEEEGGVQAESAADKKKKKRFRSGGGGNEVDRGGGGGHDGNGSSGDDGDKIDGDGGGDDDGGGEGNCAVHSSGAIEGPQHSHHHKQLRRLFELTHGGALLPCPARAKDFAPNSLIDSGDDRGSDDGGGGGGGGSGDGGGSSGSDDDDDDDDDDYDGGDGGGTGNGGYSNNQSSSSSSSSSFSSSSSSSSDDLLEQYRAVGRLMGACLWHGKPMGKPFALAFLRRVLEGAAGGRGGGVSKGRDNGDKRRKLGTAHHDDDGNISSSSGGSSDNSCSSNHSSPTSRSSTDTTSSSSSSGGNVSSSSSSSSSTDSGEGVDSCRQSGRSAKALWRKLKRLLRVAACFRSAGDAHFLNGGLVVGGGSNGVSGGGSGSGGGSVNGGGSVSGGGGGDLWDYLEMVAGSDEEWSAVRNEFKWVLEAKQCSSLHELFERGELPPRFEALCHPGHKKATTATRKFNDNNEGGGGDTGYSSDGGNNGDDSKRGLLRAWVRGRVFGDLWPQALAVSQGLVEVVPAPLLSLFTARELQYLLVSGFSSPSYSSASPAAPPSSSSSSSYCWAPPPSPVVDDASLRLWRQSCQYRDDNEEGGDDNDGETPASEAAVAAAAAADTASAAAAAAAAASTVGVVPFGPSHQTVRWFWECLARASGAERAAVWRFVTGTYAPPPPHFEDGAAGNAGPGATDNDNPPFTLVQRKPLPPIHDPPPPPTPPFSATDGGSSPVVETETPATSATYAKEGVGGALTDQRRNGSTTTTTTTTTLPSDGGETSEGRLALFTATTCFRELHLPPPTQGSSSVFASMPQLARCLAQSVAAGLFYESTADPRYAVIFRGSSGGGGSGRGGASVGDAALSASVHAAAAAAARVAQRTPSSSSSSSSSGSSGDHAGGGGASGAEVEVDLLAVRSLFPNSYMCPRCGCGPIEHVACDNLKSHHNERRQGGVKVSNSCPRCGFFSKQLSQWKPWDGSFD